MTDPVQKPTFTPSPIPGQPPTGPSVYYADPNYPRQPVYYAEETSGASWLGEITPRRILRILRQRWLTIVLSASLAFLLGYHIHRRIPRQYEATSLIEVSVRQPRIASREGAVLDDQSGRRTSEILNNRVARFRSVDMYRHAYQIFQELAGPEMENVAPLPRPGTPAFASGEETEQLMMPPAQFNLVRDSTLVTINVRGPNPQLVATSANAYAQAAKQMMEIENRETSDMAVVWLQEQAVRQRRLVEKTEQAVVDYRRSKNIDSIETRAVIANDSLRSSGGELAALENKRVRSQKLLDAIDTARLTPESVERLPRETPFVNEIAEAMNRLVAVRNQREALGARYTDQHPEVLAAEQTVQFARSNVEHALRQSKETVQADVRLLDQQVGELRRRVEQLAAQASDLEHEAGQARATLAGFEREHEAADSSYSGILSRIEQARLSADEHTAMVKIVNPAHVPLRPFAPSARRNLGLALLLGLGIGGLLALVKDVIDDLLQHDEDVEAYFGLKSIAVVPLIKKKPERNEIMRISDSNKHSHFAESFAGLRSVLDSPGYLDHSKVLLVTSTAPEVGKTITSTNLAITIAQRGERVLLVDFDMRRPQLRRLFNLPDNSESLLHVLAAQDAKRFAKLPCSTDIVNLDVAGSRTGRGEISAAEVLGSRFVKNFVDWARENYDRIILDSPPYGVVHDASILSGLSDGLLMVVRPGKTRKHSSRNAIRHLSSIGSPVLGIVINGLDYKKAATFSYYSHYYSHYRYGYTYPGFKKDSAKKGE